MKAKYIVILTFSTALAIWLFNSTARPVSVVFIDAEPKQENTPNHLGSQQANAQQTPPVNTTQMPTSQPETNDFEEFDLDEFDPDTFDFSSLSAFEGPVLTAQEIYNNALTEPFTTFNASLYNRPYPPAKSAEAEAFWDSIADVSIESGGDHELTESLFQYFVAYDEKITAHMAETLIRTYKNLSGNLSTQSEALLMAAMSTAGISQAAIRPELLAACVEAFLNGQSDNVGELYCIINYTETEQEIINLLDYWSTLLTNADYTLNLTSYVAVYQAIGHRFPGTLGRALEIVVNNIDTYVVDSALKLEILTSFAVASNKQKFHTQEGLERFATSAGLQQFTAYFGEQLGLGDSSAESQATLALLIARKQLLTINSTDDEKVEGFRNWLAQQAPLTKIHAVVFSRLKSYLQLTSPNDFELKQTLLEDLTVEVEQLLAASENFCANGTYTTEEVTRFNELSGFVEFMHNQGNQQQEFYRQAANELSRLAAQCT